VGIAPDIEVTLPKIKDPKNGEAAHMIIREKDLDRHLKNETVKDPEKAEKKPKEQSGEDEIVLESVPKDDKDDIQLQKAIELLKTGDIFKNLPPKQQAAEKTEKNETAK